MADTLKYRQITGLFTARLPDGSDADEHPDTVRLSGRVTFHPEYKKPLVFPGEHIVLEPIPALLVDGQLMVEVLQGDDVVLQDLYLPVTVDERANQSWSWRMVFDHVTLGQYGDEVSLPDRRFPVEEGDGPLDLSEVAGTWSGGTLITRGAPGAGLTDITAANGEIEFVYSDGKTTTVEMPDAVPGPPGEGIPQTITATGATISLSDGGGSVTIPTATTSEPGLLTAADKQRIDSSASAAYVDSTADQLVRLRPSAVVTYGTTTEGVAYHLIEVPGGPVPALTTNHYVEPPAIGGEPAVKNIGEMARERGGSIIFNSHGHGTTRIWGPVIKGGQALQEFQAGSRGSEALGFYSDGTAGVFKASRGDTAASMVSEGVMECFSFGPILVEGGEPRDVDNDPVFSNLAPLSARQILGVKEDGSLFLATTEGSTGASGLGGTDTALFAESLGAYHAIMLDGGGSAQTLVNGNQIHLSSDAGFLRAVPAVGEIRAFVPAVDSGWHTLSYASGVVAVQENRRISGRVRNGRVQLYGAAQPRDGFVPGQWLHVTTLPAWMRPSVPNLVWLPCATDTGQSGTASVSGGNGQVQVKVSAFSEGLEPSYVDLSGLTFEARW